jgi:nitrate reductase assembly molybdenum cofactor insertion protein NarJ
MTTTLNPNQESRRAMAAALDWRLIGLLLERPRSGWIEEAQDLAAETGDKDLRDAVQAARGATEGTYLSLFAEGGFVSPRETTWRHREDPGQILADIAGFYEAFAFRPRAEDPLDHVAVEAGFIGYLCLKEAQAAASSMTISATSQRSGPSASPPPASLTSAPRLRHLSTVRSGAEFLAASTEPAAPPEDESTEPHGRLSTASGWDLQTRSRWPT